MNQLGGIAVPRDMANEPLFLPIPACQQDEGDDRAAGEDTTPLDTDELWERYAARVYRFAAMLCPEQSDAEDLAHDALIRAINGLASFDRRRGSVEGWLWRVVVNAARDSGRAELRQRRLLARIQEWWLPAAAAVDIADAIADERLLAAVRQLSSRHRTLIALRFGGDLDYAGVGAALGISPVAARLATRRALLSLRQDLERRP